MEIWGNCQAHPTFDYIHRVSNYNCIMYTTEKQLRFPGLRFSRIPLKKHIIEHSVKLFFRPFLVLHLIECLLVTKISKEKKLIQLFLCLYQTVIYGELLRYDNNTVQYAVIRQWQV